MSLTPLAKNQWRLTSRSWRHRPPHHQRLEPLQSLLNFWDLLRRIRWEPSLRRARSFLLRKQNQMRNATLLWKFNVISRLSRKPVILSLSLGLRWSGWWLGWVELILSGDRFNIACSCSGKYSSHLKCTNNISVKERDVTTHLEWVGGRPRLETEKACSGRPHLISSDFSSSNQCRCCHNKHRYKHKNRSYAPKREKEDVHFVWSRCRRRRTVR